ncbi:saccharopine dehydrogenase NADP-binding domain-containing protein [Panacibacter sp. DH6]|uniref:Saccharopine dehydrogenase NADP-binding domain-containing protein n=1 Tax=Panacibacter microcysteis TaxID=2793269 RepID=A0A931MER8_9BACT|nr:saccharopine dehydrogenase C-terminal domain-containing protein [Panacibacter microcysteis]MBG9378444.1 saccharopine dehydrogenase NADP-binding domain-containing protein [Panacibacter microcysteis]
MKIAVLGSGMVGRTMALDLAQKHAVTSFDASEHALATLQSKSTHIQTIQTDLSAYENYPALLQPFDLVITAVPGFMGFNVLKAVIEAGKNVVDISFFPEDALELDGLARQKNVTAITDCGVAPGVSNLVIGYYNTVMKIDSFECYVGGLPKTRRKPFEYKAPFSPIDVVEEYTRPARLKENGQIVTKPAMTEIELMDFDEIGTLECFNTDGLRSILYTMPHVPNLKEKTLRYPGHAALIVALQRSGFFSEEIIDYKGASIRPIDYTAAILLKEWKLGAEEEEFTVMKVVVKGKIGDAGKTVEYTMLDKFDPESKTSSMSRTTGYTCTAAANAFADGLITKKGVFPPELIADDKRVFDYIMHYLKDRNVRWIKREY